MSWVLLTAGVAVVIGGLVQGVTSDPRTGEGWGGGVVTAIFAGGPLLAVGGGLRSQNQRVARWTVVAATAAALVVTFVLVMQLLDRNESPVNRAITSLVLVAYVLAAVVERPLARHQR